MTLDGSTLLQRIKARGDLEVPFLIEESMRTGKFKQYWFSAARKRRVIVGPWAHGRRRKRGRRAHLGG
jgi:hypothetical protein